MIFLKKKFNLPTVILIFLILALNGCSEKNYVLIDNEKIKVEIADDDTERARGLMSREFLDEKSGMLFVFEEEGKHSFWMKNTLIPLDMIFISKDLEVVDIKHAAPCHREPCESYVPEKEVKYVLEVNGNFTARNGVEVGDKVKIRLCPKSLRM